MLRPISVYLGRYAPLDVVEQRVLDEFTDLLSPVETGLLTRSRLRAKASIPLARVGLHPSSRLQGARRLSEKQQNRERSD